MSASATPAAPLRVVKPGFDVWPVAALVASAIGVAAKTVGAAMLIPMAERLVYGRAGDTVTAIVLSAGSIRPFLAMGASAVVFMALYTQLSKLRALANGVMGLLLVGALLGTIRWMVIRAVVSYPVPMPALIQASAWLADALFCGPALVWTVQQFAPGAAPHRLGRAIAFMLAAVAPALWLAVWVIARR